MPVESPSPFFIRMGFVLHHTPGIARAWRRELPSGDYLLVTNVEGYDLPEIGGPYSASYFTVHDECIEFVPLLSSAKLLVKWVLHIQRRSQRNTSTNTKNPQSEP